MAPFDLQENLRLEADAVFTCSDTLLQISGSDGDNMATLKEDVIPERSSEEILVAASERGRLDSIDLVRGLVMVIMALDHVSDYFNAAFFSKPPIGSVDLAQTTPALFLTRWVTHFCSPTSCFSPERAHSCTVPGVAARAACPGSC